MRLADAASINCIVLICVRHKVSHLRGQYDMKRNELVTRAWVPVPNRRTVLLPTLPALPALPTLQFFSE